MIIRKATINDLSQIQELNNQLFELELANFDKHLIKGWPLSPEGKQYFQDAINEGYVIVAEAKVRKERAMLLGTFLPKKPAFLITTLK